MFFCRIAPVCERCENMANKTMSLLSNTQGAQAKNCHGKQGPQIRLVLCGRRRYPLVFQTQASCVKGVVARSADTGIRITMLTGFPLPIGFHVQWAYFTQLLHKIATSFGAQTRCLGKGRKRKKRQDGRIKKMPASKNTCKCVCKKLNMRKIENNQNT